jgi:hypothetical protein
MFALRSLSVSPPCVRLSPGKGLKAVFKHCYSLRSLTFPGFAARATAAQGVSVTEFRCNSMRPLGLGGVCEHAFVFSERVGIERILSRPALLP